MQGPRQPQALLAAPRRFGTEPFFGEEPAHQVSGGGVIVDHQHQVAALLDRRLRIDSGRKRLRRRGLADDGGQAQGEYGPLARLAFDQGVAAHQTAEAARDREAQAGPAVLARGGGIRLCEGLEQPRYLVRRHADTRITNVEQQIVPDVPDVERDLPVLSELCSV